MSTSDDIALWHTQLAEAEAALHSIVVNGSVARMRHGDKSMEKNLGMMLSRHRVASETVSAPDTTAA
jgi:hypothetical protein